MGKFKTIFKKFLGFEEDDFDMEDREINLEEELNRQKSYYGANNLETEDHTEDKKSENKDIKLNQVEHEYDELDVTNEYKRRRQEIIMYPKTFAEACDVVEKIELGYIVIVNMEDVEIDTCKRIADFVLGAVYVLQGDVDKVAKKVFRFWIDN